MVRITHPRPQAGRQSFIGIEFRDGVAEVTDLHPEIRLALTQHGFTVENELTNYADAESPFQALPLAVEGDTSEHVSKRSKRSNKRGSELLTTKDDSQLAIVELPDGTVIGDGVSLATLPVTDEV